MDRTSGRYAEEWRFLFFARELVPDGSTYGVRAADLHREMSLHMIALGLFPRSRPIPVSQWGRPFSRSEKERPDYILALRCGRPPEAGYRLIGSFSGTGCVYRRAGPP